MKRFAPGVSQKGLTLVELLIVVGLVSLVTGGVYMIYGKSMESFRAEEQILDMQDRLRFGLEHLKRDIRRSGFLVTPNSNADINICPAPAFHLRAVTIGVGNGHVYQPGSGANPNIAPDSITMFGDFFSGQTYRTSGISGNRVYLQATANFPATEDDFNRIFSANRYLRIVTADQFEIMLPIVEARWSERSIVLSQSIPMAGGGNFCGINGFGETLEVNVAGFVGYSIMSDDRPNAPTGKSILVRQELRLDGTNPVEGTRLVVADYVVDLQFYDFAIAQDSTGSAPDIIYYPTYADLAGSGVNSLGSETDANPEDLRALTVKMTVRTAEEDPRLGFSAREGLDLPLDSFELSDMEGACRTMSSASRLWLPSLAARNLKEGVL